MVSVWYGYGIGMILDWYGVLVLHGIGMRLAWYGIGMARYCYSISIVFALQLKP